MKIAVMGTGPAGRTVAGALAKLGHDVVIGTRDPQATLERTEPNAMGVPPFATWHAKHGEVGLAAYADAAAPAEIIVNLTNGMGSIEAITAAGAENLAGKILVDIANGLDPSQGFPPSLKPVNTDSLGEQIQRAFPEARVVKTLNNMPATLIADPGRAGGGDHTVFVSGNDAGAKLEVTSLLNSLGHQDVIDLGDITTARGPEMMMAVWLRLWAALGTADFNFKIVR